MESAHLHRAHRPGHRPGGPAGFGAGGGVGDPRGPARRAAGHLRPAGRCSGRRLLRHRGREPHQPPAAGRRLRRPTADVRLLLADQPRRRRHRFVAVERVHPPSAGALRATRLPDKQREGVYGTARSLLSWLRNRDVHPWITPDPTRPAFDPRRIRHLNRHPLPLEQGRSGLRRPAGRRPHHGRPRRPRRPSHPLTRRPVGGAVRRGPRRGSEHLPDPAPRRLLLPLRVPRHHPAHDPAVLGTRRRSVGRRRHREAVVECERPHLLRRCRRPRLPPPAVRPHRHRRTAAPHRQHRPRTAHHHPHHPGQTDPHPRPSSASSPKDGRSCSPPAPPPSSPTPSPGGKDPTPPPSTPHSPKQGRQPRDHHRAQRRPGTTASSTSTTPPPHRSPPAGAGPAARDVRSRDGRGTGWPSKPGR